LRLGSASMTVRQLDQRNCTIELVSDDLREIDNATSKIKVQGPGGLETSNKSVAQRRRNNAEAQTWKKQYCSLGYRLGWLHGNEPRLQPQPTVLGIPVRIAGPCSEPAIRSLTSRIFDFRDAGIPTISSIRPSDLSFGTATEIGRSGFVFFPARSFEAPRPPKTVPSTRRSPTKRLLLRPRRR
jgi:hypothetical protein